MSGTGGGGGQRPVYIYYYVTLGLTPGPTMTWCGGSLCHTCPCCMSQEEEVSNFLSVLPESKLQFIHVRPQAPLDPNFGL